MGKSNRFDYEYDDEDDIRSRKKNIKNERRQRQMKRSFKVSSFEEIDDDNRPIVINKFNEK